jgi:hypothetical protein
MFGSEFIFHNLEVLDTLKRSFLRRTIGLPQGTNSNFLHCVFFDVLESDKHLLEKASMYKRLNEADISKVHATAFQYDQNYLGNRRSMGWVGRVEHLFRSKGYKSCPSRAEVFLKLKSNLAEESWRKMCLMKTTDLTTDIFPARSYLVEYVTFIAAIEQENFREILCFLIGSFNWSCLRTPRQHCFFCHNVSLTPIHMALCSKMLKWRVETVGSRTPFVSAVLNSLALAKDWSRLTFLLIELCTAWKIRDSVSSARPIFH